MRPVVCYAKTGKEFEKESGEAVNGIYAYLKSFLVIIGVIFIIVGIVRLVMSFQDNGSDQQKGIMMIATGIVLFSIGVIIGLIDIHFAAPAGKFTVF